MAKPFMLVVLALSAGPSVGAVLRRVREAQALGLVRTREEALDWLAGQGEVTEEDGA